jgi:uncharacterized membrane protein
MLYASVLIGHISTAILTGLVIFYILYAVVKAKTTHYSFLAILLAAIAAVEVVSGTLLIYVSPTATPLSVALHMTAYLSVCAGVEVLLYVASRYRPA